MYKYLLNNYGKSVRKVTIISRSHSIGSVLESSTECLSFDSIPGPESNKFCGTLHKYLPVIGDYNAEHLDKNAWINWCRYGPLVREALMPGVNLLHVFDPKDVEAVFRQDDRMPERRSHLAMQSYRLGKPEVYNTGGLLSTNGPEWWRLRSTFQKNFTAPQSVKSYIHNTDLVTKEFVQWIKNDVDLQYYDFAPYLNRLNLEVIGVIAFNERFNSFSTEEMDPKSLSSKVIKAAFDSNSGIMKLDKGFIWRYFKTPLYNKLAKSQAYLEKVAGNILYKNVKLSVSNQSDIETNCLLQSFLKQPGVDLKDILGTMVDILMASIDTTAYSTSFLLYHMARNPDCQEKLFQELLNLMPTADCDINPDILSKAVYTKACIRESLRLNPVSIGVGRILKKDITLRNYNVPKWTVVVTQNMVASRLPQFVKDPLQFKPERWMRATEHFEDIHPFLSLPFGFGPRSCIARRLAEQNMCIAMMRLVREFDIKWLLGELEIRTHLINKPDGSLRFKFTPRNK